MKLIPLTQGKFAMVDDEDYDKLNKFKWFCSNGYPARMAPHKKWIKRRVILMHNEIIKPILGFTTDHIDKNIYNNQKSNLRKASKAQNQYNSKNRSDNNTGFRGVFYRKDTKKWFSRVTVNRKIIHLGQFNTKEEAAFAYNKAAKENFEDFATLNIIK